MPINGNDLDEEDQIQDEDLQPAPAQQVYLPPTPPPVTPPQLIPPVSPGDLPRSMRPPVQQAPGGFNLELWREQNAQMPIAQAEQAVASAMRFQGIRQYQQDLASGMTAAEALAKSAPLLFGGPKQGNLGQAAAFIKATRPPSVQYRDIGGVLYKIPPGGEPQAITQKPRRLDAIEQGFLKADLAKLKEVEDNPAFSMPNAMGEDLRRQAHDIRNKITIRYRERTAPVAQPGNIPTPLVSTAAPQIVRPPAAIAPSTPPTITSREQFDRLPSGTIYIGKGGRRYRKP